MPRAQASRPKTVHQLKITLRDTKPPIWRRVLVPSDYNLNQVHAVIQVAMGWSNSHLHQFEVGGEYYSAPEFELDEMGDEVLDEYRYRLRSVVPHERMRANYLYDFGDSWDHAVVVEKVLPAEADLKYPRCLAARRACPPDDVGGTWGFHEFVEAMTDPAHPEHDTLTEWYGGDFDPAGVDLDEINVDLQRIGEGTSIYLGPYP